MIMPCFQLIQHTVIQSVFSLVSALRVFVVNNLNALMSPLGHYLAIHIKNIFQTNDRLLERAPKASVLVSFLFLVTLPAV